MVTNLLNRRNLIRQAGLGFLTLATAYSVPFAQAVPLPSITAYRNPGCGCCENWVAHLQAAGFQVTMHDDPDLDARRTAAGVPADIAGCHTAYMDEYVIEGHVPAEDILRFLNEKSHARGLAVAGMPMGSPGMETDGAPQKYDVMLFMADRSFRVYASH